MPRPVSPVLTDGELRLMKVLWEEGALTPAEVAAALGGDAPLAESTVRTMLGILRDKGYVEARPRGRANEYHPLVTRAEARREALRHLTASFFDGSPRELVLNLLGDREVDAGELERVRRLLAEGGDDER